MVAVKQDPEVTYFLVNLIKVKEERVATDLLWTTVIAVGNLIVECESN